MESPQDAPAGLGVPGYAPPQTPERYADGARSSTVAPPRPGIDRRPPAGPKRRFGGPPKPPGGRRGLPTAFRRLPRPRAGLFGLLAIGLVVLLIGSVFFFDSRLQRTDVMPEPRPADTPGTNWLLVGSDSRVGLTPEQEAELATGGDIGSSRTDTIILIHIPSGSGPTTMVSLPRDSYVSIPGYGQDKLNTAFALGGGSLLIQTIEQSTGIRIDRYAEIGFGGFAGIVDAVGGVNMCLPNPIDDPLAGINLAAGCQDLTGAEALGFVRTRATALADIDRMNNQRMFLSALLSKATSWSTLLNPWRMWNLTSGVTQSLTVDSGTHLWHLARLGWALRSSVVATTVPVGGFADTAAGNVLLWDEVRAPEFFGYLSRDEPLPENLITTTP
nr:LCP family protein [Millisia brevis]